MLSCSCSEMYASKGHVWYALITFLYVDILGRHIPFFPPS